MYNKIEQIKQELSKRHRDKKYLEKYYLEARLTKSLNSYYEDLERSIAYLENRQAENVMRKW